MTETDHLHLPNLYIEEFCGIDKLVVSRLGRVTLLVGKNSIGKTTVLDAVRIYAARGRYSALYNLLLDREETSIGTDEDDSNKIISDFRALFYNQDISQGACITIGPEDAERQLVIKPSILSDRQTSMLDQIEGPYVQGLEAEYGDSEPTSPIKCELLGPGLLGNDDLARLWDGAALTDDGERAVSALQLVFGADVERVAVVGYDNVYPGRPCRRAVVRLSGKDRPVPLRSLGDGALRLFSVALALARSRGGFLLIDAAESGIHHSLQRDYWNMVLRTAHENNVQVLATTHSSDCVKGFARAAVDFEDAEGVLVRLSRQYGDLRAVVYREEELAIAAEQGIEVR